MKRTLILATVLALLPGVALAQSKTFEITLAPSKSDGTNVPVCVPLVVPVELARFPVRVTDAAGKALLAQLTSPGLATEGSVEAKDGVQRDLHFVLPERKAGAEVRLKAVVTEQVLASATGFHWIDKPGEQADLLYRERPVLRYSCLPLDDSSKEKREGTFKVFHHVYDPQGKRIVTKGVGGQYTHHRGLFYGFKTVTYGPNTVDIWHCTGDTYQSHGKYLVVEAGTVLGRHRVEIGWHGKGKELFAKEERELTAYNTPGGILIDFVSKLKPVVPSVKLDGDPQHAGFHFRADNEVSAKTNKQTFFIRPDGTGKPGETRNWPMNKDHVNLPWNAMSFVLGEQRFTAAYLDHPGNPKEARCSERDYGRFGSYFVTEVPKDKPLTVRYRVWLQEGPMTGAQVAERSEQFVHPPAVKVEAMSR